MTTFFHHLKILAGMGLVLFLLVGSAHAQTPAMKAAKYAPLATFTVNSPADAVDASPGNGVCATALNVCTLRAAVQEANALAGDDIISLPAGTYTLALAGTGEDAAAQGDLDLTSNITLNGAGAATTIINANWVDRVMHVTGAFTVNLSGLTITNGNGNGGGIYNNGGALTITGSAISDNNSAADTGGIFSSGTLAITNSTLADNNAGRDAGAIFNTGTLAITDSTLADNNAGRDAGAILSSGTLTITGSVFANNNALTEGGTILNTGMATVAGSTFTNNNTSTAGGGIYSSGTLAVSESAFTGNNAFSGGGVYDAGGAITITLSAFTGNTASAGGGVFTQFDVEIANSTFSGNNASTGDDTYTAGGGLTITNSTIYGEFSDPDDAPAQGIILGGGGGGVHNAAGGGGAVTLANTIVAGHDYGGNCVGAITNGGNNLDDGVTCGWGSANGSMSSTNPLLGALTGAPAYFPLARSSPAIDAGSNTACAAAPVNNASQNGVPRPFDGDDNGAATCDIGAFERGQPFEVFLPLVLR